MTDIDEDLVVILTSCLDYKPVKNAILSKDFAWHY